MQNIFFHEVEVAYMRHRVQDAVAATSLAAQATSRSTTDRWLFFQDLIQACRRACDLFQRQQPKLQPVPYGHELPAVQG